MSLKDRNFIQRAYYITRGNIILAQPPVLFMIVLSFTLAGLAMQAHKAVYMIYLTANILLCCAFFAGWFFMVQQGIMLNKRIENGEFKEPEERAAASLALGRAFFPGVGEFFLPMTATIIAYSAVYILLIYLFYKLGLHILPNPNIDMTKLYAALSSTPHELQEFLYGLTLEQLRALNLWMLFMGSVMSAYSFITLFLFPALLDSDPEKKELFLLAPFKAFNKNIVFIFKNFLGSLGIIAFLFFLNIIVSALSPLFGLNIILGIVGLIISFYFLTYAVVLIFLYYEERKD